LLDFGADISCVGSDLARLDWAQFPTFHSISSQVRTADERAHSVLEFVSLDMTYKNCTKQIEIFVIPSISQRVILGGDFWKAFNLALGLISSLENQAILNSSSTNDNSFYLLSATQRSQLGAVISLFLTLKNKD